MIWVVYNVLFAIGYSLMLPYFIFRMVRRGGYLKGFLERLCVFDAAAAAKIRERPRIWIHAVSVGEIMVALRFIDEFRTQEPSVAFMLTTTTSTGHSIATGRLNASDVIAYFPVDFPFVIRRALDLFRPRALVLVESELWPNLVRLTAARGIPVILVNGRMSERSERGYRIVRVFFEKAINKVKLLCVQTPDDERRMVALGAKSSLVRVTGSAKYDLTNVDSSGLSRVEAALKTLGVTRDNLLIVAGSTWPGEESILVDIFKTLRARIPNLRLAIVPRHAERAAKVAAEIRSSGLSVVRRSEVGPQGTLPGDVILVDTTGELIGFYACATVVFVGKSLTKTGGQNIIEPATFGKPIIVGPHMQNFAGVIRDFLAARAIIQVVDASELEAAFSKLLGDPGLRQEYGERAVALVNAKKGAVRLTVELVRDAMKIG